MLNRTSRYINTLFAVFAFVLPHGFLISQIFSDLSTTRQQNAIVSEWRGPWLEDFILFALFLKRLKAIWWKWQLFHQRQKLISWFVTAHESLIRKTLIKDARKPRRERKTTSWTNIPWTLVANENLSTLMLDFYAAPPRATFTLSHI